MKGETVITVQETPWSTPVGWVACSESYTIGPGDLMFSVPVTLAFTGSGLPPGASASGSIVVWGNGFLPTTDTGAPTTQIEQSGSYGCVDVPPDAGYPGAPDAGDAASRVDAGAVVCDSDAGLECPDE